MQFACHKTLVPTRYKVLGAAIHIPATLAAVPTR
jgi:hypothetical protein